MTFKEVKKQIKLLKTWYLSAIALFSTGVFLSFLYVLITNIVNIQNIKEKAYFISTSGLAVTFLICLVFLVIYIIAYEGLTKKR